MPVLLFIWYVRLSKDKQIVSLVVFLGKKNKRKKYFDFVFRIQKRAGSFLVRNLSSYARKVPLIIKLFQPTWHSVNKANLNHSKFTFILP